MALSVRASSGFDDRSAIYKYRRVQLWALCRQEGVPVTEVETKNQLIMKLMGVGIDPENPPKIETDPAIIGDEAPKPEVNYGSLNFFQLRKLCTERNIAWAKTDKRTDLLARLEAA